MPAEHDSGATQVGGAATRRLLPRIGIVTLNLLAPGLGLLRAGRGTAGVLWLLAPFLLIALTSAVASLAPPITPDVYRIAFLILLAMIVALYLVPMLLSWRAAKVRTVPLPWWARWYTLLLVWIGVLLMVEGVRAAAPLRYHRFYLPSPAMAPTLEEGDRLLADRRSTAMPKRGDIILFDVDGNIYIKRVAGLPGDRIALRDGKVLIDGAVVPQTVTGRRPGPNGEALILSERFPGERRAHALLDQELTSIDNMEERRVPAAHLFVLGDNRDRSADSRSSRDIGGTEMVPLADIRGKAMFRTRDAKWRWLGDRLD